MGLEAGCQSRPKEVGQRRARKGASGCVQGGGEGEVAQAGEGEDRQTDGRGGGWGVGGCRETEMGPSRGRGRGGGWAREG